MFLLPSGNNGVIMVVFTPIKSHSHCYVHYYFNLLPLQILETDHILRHIRHHMFNDDATL